LPLAGQIIFDGHYAIDWLFSITDIFIISFSLPLAPLT
jgi:hypothetical protein